ncbi:MAG: pantoate--beta-alanine ligase [Bdellovibrionales bacterium]|nr:pantoate--beta-alanine ligase [Bdellovibrionales bacterium]
MKTFETVEAYRPWRKGMLAGARIGFVPTMGALHQGHAKLIRQSMSENDVTVLSIFVNPTQFNQKSDFENYPSTLVEDLAMAEKLGVDAVFAPKLASALYPKGYRVKVTEDILSKELCGAHRPGHFDGVLTVVMKLFNIVRPTHAYFGEKDYQQYLLVKEMVEDYFIDLKLVPVPTEYESSGLALSSRNARILPEHKIMAPLLHRAMVEFDRVDDARAAVEDAGFVVDYLEDKHLENGETRRFAAAWLGDVRLIDNVKL